MSDAHPAVPGVPEEFARRQRRQFVVTIPLIAIALGAAMSLDYVSSGATRLAAAVAFGAALLSAVVFSLVNWRCPACRAYLRKATNPKFCPNCGVPFKKT